MSHAERIAGIRKDSMNTSGPELLSSGPVFWKESAYLGGGGKVKCAVVIPILLSLEGGGGMLPTQRLLLPSGS